MNARVSSLFRRLRQLQGSPLSLARGTAVGVLVGFAPISPFKAMLIVLVTTVSRSSTVAALVVCTAICNPLTYLPLYYTAWLIGNFLLPGRASWEVLKTGIGRMRESGLVDAATLAGQLGFDTVMVVLTGGLVLALPLALVSYPVAYKLFCELERRRNEQALIRKKEEAVRT